MTAKWEWKELDDHKDPWECVRLECERVVRWPCPQETQGHREVPGPGISEKRPFACPFSLSSLMPGVFVTSALLFLGASPL